MNRIKESFKKIGVSEDLEKRILNKTINQEKKSYNSLNWGYTLVIAIIIGLFSTSIVYAEEIKQVIKSWSTRVNVGENNNVELEEDYSFFKVPENALKSEENKKLNYDEIEKILDTKLLNLENNNPDIYYSTGLNDDDSIGRVDLWIPQFIDNNNTKVFLFISILNESADVGYINAFIYGLDAAGDKKIIDNYKDDNLNTKVILYTSENDLTAVFVYNNILYQLTGTNITKNQMTSIIEKLK